MIESKKQLSFIALQQPSSDLEDIGGSHTILYKSIRHVSGYFIHSFQARAMTRNKESRPQSL